MLRARRANLPQMGTAGVVAVVVAQAKLETPQGCRRVGDGEPETAVPESH